MQSYTSIVHRSTAFDYSNMTYSWCKIISDHIWLRISSEYPSSIFHKFCIIHDSELSAVPWVSASSSVGESCNSICDETHVHSLQLSLYCIFGLKCINSNSRNAHVSCDCIILLHQHNYRSFLNFWLHADLIFDEFHKNILYHSIFTYQIIYYCK